MDYLVGAIVLVALLMAAEFLPARWGSDASGERRRRRRATITRALRIGRKRKRNPGNRWQRERDQRHPVGFPDS